MKKRVIVAAAVVIAIVGLGAAAVPLAEQYSARQIKAGLHVGQDRAREIHAHLSAVANAPREHAT